MAAASISFTNCTLSGNRADEANSNGGFVEAHNTYSWTGLAPADPVFFMDLG